VDPVLAVPVRDEDVAVGHLDRVGWHIERLAVGPLWPLAPSACKRRANFLCSVSRLLERILTSLDQIDRWSITKETH
jgi:hypothetical protein